MKPGREAVFSIARGAGARSAAMLTAVLLIAGCQKFEPKGNSVGPEALAKSELDQEAEEVEVGGRVWLWERVKQIHCA